MISTWRHALWLSTDGARQARGISRPHSTWGPTECVAPKKRRVLQQHEKRRQSLMQFSVGSVLCSLGRRTAGAAQPGAPSPAATPPVRVSFKALLEGPSCCRYGIMPCQRAERGVADAPDSTRPVQKQGGCLPRTGWPQLGALCGRRPVICQNWWALTPPCPRPPGARS